MIICFSNHLDKITSHHIRKQTMSNRSLCIAKETALEQADEKLSVLCEQLDGLMSKRRDAVPRLEKEIENSARRMAAFHLMLALVVAGFEVSNGNDLTDWKNGGLLVLIALLCVYQLYRYMYEKDDAMQHPPPTMRTIMKEHRRSSSGGGLAVAMASGKVEEKKPVQEEVDWAEIEREALTAITEFSSKVDGAVIKTQEELDAVLELRKRLGDLPTSKYNRSFSLADDCLIRFLRARKLNLEKAEKMFRDAYEWRLKTNPTEIYQRLSREVKEGKHPLYQYTTGGWCGNDKDGNPIFIDRIGELDVAGLLGRATQRNLNELIIFRQEHNTRLMMAAEKKYGHPIYQMTVISDLTGLGMKHAQRRGLKMLKLAAQIDDLRYPERLKIGFIISAPRVFSWIWSMVQHFFDPVTREKLQIHSTGVPQLLLQHVDKEVLPKFLGGERTAANGTDPYCKDVIMAGGKVPADVPTMVDPDDDDDDDNMDE